MTNAKNNLGLSAALEYFKGRSVLLDAAFAQQIGLAPSVPSPLAENNAPLDPEELLFVPLNLQDPVKPQNTLRTSDLIFCDRPEYFRGLEECNVCRKNPAAYVPDWRTLPLNSNFLNGRTCQQSVVVDTGRTGIPKVEEVIESIKRRGIELLLDAYGKSQITTTVYYVLNNQNEPENRDLSVLTIQSEQEELNGLRIADKVNVGASAAELLGEEGTAPLSMPRFRTGYRRLLRQVNTADILLETNNAQGLPAVTIEYFVPRIAGKNTVTTKALVSVDANSFALVPTAVVTTPAITRELDLDNTIEVTIQGARLRNAFKQARYALRRSNIYATRAIKGTNEGRFYRAGDETGIPVVYDFNEEARQLMKYMRTILIPAIQKGGGFRVTELDKIRIVFETRESNTQLKVVDAVLNKLGCKEFSLLDYDNKINEVTDFFSYSRSTTLGYVAALPNIENYLRATPEVVWLDFITQFTYPAVEFKNPLDLVTLEDDRSLAECVAQKTGAELVGKVLNDILDTPDLVLDGLTESICKAAADVAADRLAEEDVIAAARIEDVEEIKKQIKAKRKELSALDPEDAGYDSESFLIETEISNLNAALENAKDARKAAKSVSRSTANSARLDRATKQLQKKLAAASTSYEERPLAKILVTAITYGIEQAVIEEKTSITPMVSTPKELAVVQEAINKTGGWCGIVQLILEASQCLMKGLGVDDFKKTVIAQVLKGMRVEELLQFIDRLEPVAPDATAKIQREVADLFGVGLEALLNSVVESNSHQTFDYADKIRNRANQLMANDSELSRADARKAAKQELIKERELRNSQEQKVSPAGTITSSAYRSEVNEEALEAAQSALQLVDLIVEFIMEAIDGQIDRVFDILEESTPGFTIIRNMIRDIECLVPDGGLLNPPLGQSLKSLNFDLCALSKTGKIEFTRPRLNPPLNGAEIKANLRNFHKLLADYLLDLLIDLSTQLLINAITSIVEAVLDLACDLIAAGAASIADELTGNSKFKEDLRRAVCPDDELTDAQFQDAMSNIFSALTNTASGTDCVANLTKEELGNFLDSVLVTISYNELYNLLLGDANPNTYKIVSELAKASGSDCIAEIFGNIDNVISYFSGLGSIIDARNAFDSFPEDVFLRDNLNVCPPDTQDIIRDIQAKLLEGKGLSDQQIQDQLDYAKERAKEKLENLVDLLTKGPYKDLPSLAASGECPSSGLLRSSPAVQTALLAALDANAEAGENAILRDLMGNNGLFPRILSDSEGQGLKLHRFLTSGLFGNSIGRKNLLYQFYSDDALVYSELDLNKRGETTLKAKELRRVNQYGEKYPVALSLIQPMGGFPPTIGAYLYGKMKNSEIGLIDSDEEGRPSATQLTFKTRLQDPEIRDEIESAKVRNERIINKRKLFIAKWAAATHFVDYETLKAELIELKDGMPVIEGGNTIPLADQITIETLNTEAKSWTNPTIEKRRAIYIDLINACSQPVFLSGINYREYSAEERLQRLLSSETKDKKNLLINGRIVGISLADYRDRIKTRKFDNIGSGVKQYYNINLARKFTLTQQLRDFYMEIAEDNYDSVFSPIPLDNPFELGMEFIPYKEKKAFVAGDAKLEDQDIKISVTYNMNPQNDDGTFFEDKYKYRVAVIETINPFGEPKRLSNKDQLDDLYNPEIDAVPDAVAAPIVPGAAGSADIQFYKDISSVPDAQVQGYIDQYIGDTTASDVKYSYETEFFRNWLNANVAKEDIRFKEDIDSDKLVKFFDFVNQGFFRRVAARIAVPDSAVQYKEHSLVESEATENGETRFTINDTSKNLAIANGFLFGYDPAAQPEAIVLDPAKYGGTEARPPFYLEPPAYKGWLGLLQKFMPPEESCDPKSLPLYDMRDISDDMQSLFGRLNRDERLNFQPFCTKEAPYDSVRDSATTVSLEGMIRMTTRVHTIDFLLKCVPVLSQYSANFEGNFDDLLETYLGDYVIDRVRDQGVTSPTRNITVTPEGTIFIGKDTVPTNKYYYNFLETAVSNIIRKIESGVIDRDQDLNQDQKKALTEIEAVINDYYNNFDGTEAVLSEEAISAQDMINRATSPSARNQSNLGRGSAKFSKARARRIKVGLLYATIRKTESQAKTLFSLYVKQEFDALRKRLDSALQPEIDDLGLMMVSDGTFINGAIAKRSYTKGEVFNDIDEGEASEPVYVTRPDGTIEYEVAYDVPYVAADGKLKSNIKSRTIQLEDTEEEINEQLKEVFGGALPFTIDLSEKEGTSWPFVLEKYIRIEEKAGVRVPEQDIVNRDDSLRGVVNINSWVEYLNTLPADIRKGKISDYWQDWHFGLRVSLMLDRDDESLGQLLKNKGLLFTSEAKTVTLEDGTKKILVPIAAGELPIIDQTITDATVETRFLGAGSADMKVFKEPDLLRQYDTLCLVNELVATDEYRAFFEYLFPLKRYLSLVTIFVANTFYLSIGNSGNADPDGTVPAGDRWAAPGGRIGSTFRRWDKNYDNFRRSTRIFKRLFMELYRTRNKAPARPRAAVDRDRRKESVKDLLADLIPDKMLDGMPWWQRRSRIDKPFDMFDNECADEEDYF